MLKIRRCEGIAVTASHIAHVRCLRPSIERAYTNVLIRLPSA